MGGNTLYARLLVLAALLICAAAPARAVSPQEIVSALRNTTVRSPEQVERFYAARGYSPAWFTFPGDALAELRDAVRDAITHGLDPADYHLDALERTATEGPAARSDILATDAFLTYGGHLLHGKVNPVSVEPSWTAIRRSRDLAAFLQSSLEANSIEEALGALAPDLRSYDVLRRGLARYRALAAAGGWTGISYGAFLKRGMRGARVAALRRRLEAEHLLAPAPGNGRSADQEDIFDPEVEAAVASFQDRTGLRSDGVAGPATLRELNRAAAERVDQIRVNMERLRWLPYDLGTRHIRVNIAAFQLEAWENGAVVRSHEAIVGRTYRKTPIFSGAISYLVFNPWWDTPASIAKKDELPAFRRDPGLPERLGFDILDRASGRRVDASTIDWSSVSATDFPYRLRQRPGTFNALGKVKFMFPNPHNVYLHDTPARELFANSRRDFSSGCIRVRDAVGLAGWVLSREDGWDRQRMDSAIESGKERRLSLRHPVPVHILYLTAVAMPTGSVRFVSDVYDRDRDLLAALDRAPSDLR